MLYFLIIVSSFSFLSGFDTVRSGPGAPGPAATPTPRRRPPPALNSPANVDSVELDKTELLMPCAPWTKRHFDECPEETVVNVTTKATDPENDVLLYKYTVTGGTIEGKGANIRWNLSGLRPGTYKITAGVDDGCGVCGETVTRQVFIKECIKCSEECFCPGLEILKNAGSVQRGQILTFTARTDGGSEEFKTFNWSISSGIITEGQGTSTIKVDTKGVTENEVIATVAASGACSIYCEASASAIIKLN